MKLQKPPTYVQGFYRTFALIDQKKITHCQTYAQGFNYCIVVLTSRKQITKAPNLDLNQTKKGNTAEKS